MSSSAARASSSGGTATADLSGFFAKRIQITVINITTGTKTDAAITARARSGTDYETVYQSDGSTPATIDLTSPQTFILDDVDVDSIRVAGDGSDVFDLLVTA